MLNELLKGWSDRTRSQRIREKRGPHNNISLSVHLDDKYSGEEETTTMFCPYRSLFEC